MSTNRGWFSDRRGATGSTGSPGAPGTPGAPGPGFQVRGEIPAEVPDGIITDFELQNTDAQDLCVFRNGLRLTVIDDYTYDGDTTVSFVTAPVTGAKILFDYSYTPAP